MDLLATVKKEGSRGGRGDFKWSDVQNSSHREHYLGHSLMAPVGRWAKNRDLSWYTKADNADDAENPEDKAARERKEEIKRIKEAEEDALARALGLPVPDRTNANLIPIAEKQTESKETDQQESSELKQALKEYKRRHSDHDHKRRHRSRSPERKHHRSERRHRHRSHERSHRRQSRSRSRERDRHRRPRSRSPRPSRRYDRD